MARAFSSLPIHNKMVLTGKFHDYNRARFAGAGLTEVVSFI